MFLASALSSQALLQGISDSDALLTVFYVFLALVVFISFASVVAFLIIRALSSISPSSVSAPVVDDLPSPVVEPELPVSTDVDFKTGLSSIDNDISSLNDSRDDFILRHRQFLLSLDDTSLANDKDLKASVARLAKILSRPTRKISDDSTEQVKDEKDDKDVKDVKDVVKKDEAVKIDTSPSSKKVIKSLRTTPRSDKEIRALVASGAILSGYYYDFYKNSSSLRSSPPSVPPVVDLPPRISEDVFSEQIESLQSSFSSEFLPVMDSLWREQLDRGDVEAAKQVLDVSDIEVDFRLREDAISILDSVREFDFDSDADVGF